MGIPGMRTAFQGRAKQILIRLADNGVLHTNQLVAMFQLKRQGISTYLTRLREAGFINSEKNGRDKRYVYHSLTVEGRQYLDGF